MPNIKIKTAEAALIMGCSPQFVRIGLQQGILDIARYTLCCVVGHDITFIHLIKVT